MTCPSRESEQSSMNKSPTATALAAILVTIVLAGCGASADWDETCADTYERAVLTVDAVASAEFECGGSFGAGTENGTVTLAVDTQQEATPVIEEIYRAFAVDPELSGVRSPAIDFVSENGETRFSIDDLGFGGEPSVDQMRETYGITPSPTS